MRSFGVRVEVLGFGVMVVGGKVARRREARRRTVSDSRERTSLVCWLRSSGVKSLSSWVSERPSAGCRASLENTFVLDVAVDVCPFEVPFRRVVCGPCVAGADTADTSCVDKLCV